MGTDTTDRLRNLKKRVPGSGRAQRVRSALKRAAPRCGRGLPVSARVLPASANWPGVNVPNC